MRRDLLCKWRCVQQGSGVYKQPCITGNLWIHVSVCFRSRAEMPSRGDVRRVLETPLQACRVARDMLDVRAQRLETWSRSAGVDSFVFHFVCLPQSWKPRSDRQTPRKRKYCWMMVNMCYTLLHVSLHVFSTPMTPLSAFFSACTSTCSRPQISFTTKSTSSG